MHGKRNDDLAVGPVAFLFMEEGAFAARCGLPASENPYEAGSDRGNRWLMGWLEARDPCTADF